MAKNAQFREAMERLDNLTNESKAALDAIAQADYGNTDGLHNTAFRKAINEHQAFWRKTNQTLSDNLSLYDNSVDFLNPNDPDGNNFEDLRKLALERRIILALDALSDDNLLSLVTDAGNIEQFRAHLISPDFQASMPKLADIPEWAAVDDPILNADSINTIAAAAAKKHIERQAVVIFEEHYADDLAEAAQLLNELNVNFCDHLTQPYRGVVQPQMADDVKKILGQQYVNTIIDFGVGEVDDLKHIASSANAGALRSTLIIGELNATAARLAITDDNADSYRHRVAEKAVLIRLSQCRDLNVLDAIEQANTGKDLASLLEAHPVLSFSGAANQAFRTTIGTMTNIEAIQTAAKVYSSTITATADDLEPFIAMEVLPDDVDPAPAAGSVVAQQYRDKFLPAGTSLESLKAHFSKPENILALREQSLLTVMKEKFKSMNGVDLGHAAGGQLQAPVTDQHAVDLLARPNVSERLRAIAQCEMVVRLPGQNTNHLLDTINMPISSTIPVSDQNYIRGRLAQALIENYSINSPEHETALMDITKANDEAKLKAALTKLGVTALDWVNAGSIATMQKAACLRMFAEKIKAFSNFDASVRPELISLLNSLPIEAQRKLLANDKFFPAILMARSSAELAEILDVPPDTFTQRLLNEYTRMMRSELIQNAELAKILANFSLNDDRNSHINGLLISNAGDLSVDDYYIQTINNMSVSLIDSQRGPFRLACGLNEPGDAIVDHALQQKIAQQQQYNTPLFLRNISGLSTHHLELHNYLLTLMKGAPLATVASDNILSGLISSTSYNDFVTRKLRGLDPVLLASIKNTLTQAQYTNWKQALAREKFSKPDKVEDMLAASRAKLQAGKDRVAELSRFDFDIRKKMLKLANMNSFLWLSPEFQSTAKQDVKALKASLKDLPEACDTIVKQFDNRIAEVKQLLAELPLVSNDDAIEQHRAELKAALVRFNNGRDHYVELQRWLRGHELATPGTMKHKGILAVIEDVEKGEKDIARFTGYTVFRTEYDAADKAKLLAGTLARPAVSSLPVDVTTQETNNGGYVIGNKAAPGKIFEYTVGSTEASKGCFIEERLANDMAIVTRKGAAEVVPQARYTLSKFPSDPAARLDPAVAMTIAAARVDTAMAMASQILRDRPANSTKPIVLRNGTAEELEFVWTALMVLGKQNPKLNINKSTLVIDSPLFDPDKQTGFFGGKGFAKDSCYAMYFKNHTGLKVMTDSFKNMADIKYSPEKFGKEKVGKKVEQVTNKFKSAVQTGGVVDKMKTDNIENENSTPPSMKR